MIDRRRFVGASLALLLWPAAAGARPAAPRRLAALDGEVETLLEKSGFVYVSPLKSDGSESRCHGEVWYGWIDGAVVVNTAPGTWKGRSLAQGLDQARIWVGDHGRWKRPLGGRNERFRQAPSFDARAELSKDEALLERLLAIYEKKYPAEIASWRDRMRAGFHDGSRLLIRYVPEGGSKA